MGVWIRSGGSGLENGRGLSRPGGRANENGGCHDGSRRIAFPIDYINTSLRCAEAPPEASDSKVMPSTVDQNSPLSREIITKCGEGRTGAEFLTALEQF